MPQLDLRRSIEVPLEFEPRESLAGLPVKDRATLVFVSDGKAVVLLNGVLQTVSAPCVLCLSDKDAIEVIDNARLCAQSFSLSPSYLRWRYTYRQKKNHRTGLANEELWADVLDLFYRREPGYTGVIKLPPDAVTKVLEWMSVISNELKAQSDGRWTCRVRAYFLRILNYLDELYELGEKPADALQTPVDAVLAHIHMRYMEEISLETLCAIAHTNRTTLNRRLKERTGQTAIDYLLSYRLRVAAELLAHTGLTIDTVAQASGFAYGTYLIRQFTAKMGKSPTQYRQETREKHHIVIQKES